MINFKKINEELYLITNFKVMYSTLSEQKSIECVHFSKKKILLNNLYLGNSEFYLLVRNPYKRLESFFKDKFRQTVRHNQEKEKWQRCHKFFFAHLGLNESSSTLLVADKLLSLTFSEFIFLLPFVFKNDGHLHPQHWAKTLETKNIKLPIRYKKVFKMELKEDLEEMTELFNININNRVNSTKTVKEKITWHHEELEIVEKIYKEDFKKFNYKKMTVTNKG